MKQQSNKQLTLQEFKSKRITSNKELETYTNQVLAYGLEQHMGSGSGILGAATRIRIRGVGSIK